jgi:hypothetical protein
VHPNEGNIEARLGTMREIGGIVNDVVPWLFAFPLKEMKSNESEIEVR